MQQVQQPVLASEAVNEPSLNTTDIKLVGALLDALMEADFENKRIEGVGSHASERSERDTSKTE